MSIAIPFILQRSRVSTDYIKLKRIFKPEADFQAWLQEQLSLFFAPTAPDLALSIQATPLKELYLESAYTCYSLTGKDIDAKLHIDFMQSTARTSRCFDIFIRVEGLYPPGLLEALPPYLEGLRQRFNGDWIIEDQHLSFDTLK